MKVIPWMSHNGQGEGYQLVLSGHRQYNVRWVYGADHVLVDVCDKHENPDAGWSELKRIAIPSDYRGKPWRDVATGMRDHMRVICRGLTREWEGGGVMSEFRDEWAMHKWYEGQKVSYKTVRNGLILGVVTGVERRGTSRFVHFRVASRKNPMFKCGSVESISPSDPWFTSREA
ncbi:hypothetical protein ACFY5K_25590 [Streptomyces griseofuscus]|uniref:hypothetical protein n=1 Tax=Streptomyces griseofuscus TaxID=146922 RepID=UPI0036BE9C70